MNKINQYLNNLWPVTVVLALTSILKEVRGLEFFDVPFQLLLLAGLVIGSTQILYQLWKHKFSSKFVMLLLAFIVTIGISSILNREALVANVKETAVMAVVLLGGFIEINSSSDHKKTKILTILSRSVLIITLIVSLGSIITFFAKINTDTEFIFLGKTISIGIYNNRLFGLYQSLTLPIAPIAFLIGFVYLNSQKITKNWKIMTYLSMFFNILYVSLSFSSGIIVSLTMVAGLFSIILLLPRFNNLKIIKSFVLGTVIAGLVFGLLIGTRVLVYKFANPNIVSNNNMDEMNPPDTEEPGALDKQRPYGFLTGRDTIWSYGFEQLKDQPLIGYGPQAFVGTEVLGTQKLQHMHSVYVQALVSGGIMHFIPFVILIAVVAFKVLQYCFTKSDDKNYFVNLAIASIIGFLLVHALIETNFLYVNRFPLYAFWIYLALMNIDFIGLKSDKKHS